MPVVGAIEKTELESLYPCLLDEDSSTEKLTEVFTGDLFFPKLSLAKSWERTFFQDPSNSRRPIFTTLFFSFCWPTIQNHIRIEETNTSQEKEGQK